MLALCLATDNGASLTNLIITLISEHVRTKWRNFVYAENFSHPESDLEEMRQCSHVGLQRFRSLSYVRHGVSFTTFVYQSKPFDEHASRPSVAKVCARIIEENISSTNAGWKNRAGIRVMVVSGWKIDEAGCYVVLPVAMISCQVVA